MALIIHRDKGVYTMKLGRFKVVKLNREQYSVEDFDAKVTLHAPNLEAAFERVETLIKADK